MSDDERRERVVVAIRAAIEKLQATEGREGSRALRDALHALSVCRAMHRDLKESAMPKRRRRKVV